MIKRFILSLFLISVLLPSVPSCMGSGPTPQATVAILNKEMGRDDTGAVFAIVMVKNTSRFVAELVEVTVEFYDTRKNFISSASDSIINLGPDETWEFEIYCEGDGCGEAASCDIKVTTGASSGRF